MSKSKPEKSDDHSLSASTYDWSWFRKGMANLFSIPALILISAFIGFGGLAREAGIPLAQLIFMVPAIWALPSHLLLVGGIGAGIPLVAIAPAVALASVRMMPMTMALMPEIRTEKSKSWHLLLASNCVAITAWVHTLEVARTIPRRGRLPYFIGFASTLMVVTTCAAAIVHEISAGFPPLLMAALYFLTPLYFAASIWKTARVKAEFLALGFGFTLGLLLVPLFPQTNILVAGIGGGIAAFLIHLALKRRGLT